MPVQPCPACGTNTPRKLDASEQARVNYYRCPACGHVWTTTKDGGAIVDHVTPAPSTRRKMEGLQRRSSELRKESAKARQKIRESQDHIQQAMHRTAEFLGHTQNIARSMAESSGVERANVAAYKRPMTNAGEPVVDQGLPDKSDARRDAKVIPSNAADDI